MLFFLFQFGIGWMFTYIFWLGLSVLKFPWARGFFSTALVCGALISCLKSSSLVIVTGPWALRMVFMVTCLHMCSLAQGLWNSSQRIHLNSTLTFQGNSPVIMVHTCQLINGAAQREENESQTGLLLFFLLLWSLLDKRLFPCPLLFIACVLDSMLGKTLTVGWTFCKTSL